MVGGSIPALRMSRMLTEGWFGRGIATSEGGNSWYGKVDGLSLRKPAAISWHARRGPIAILNFYKSLGGRHVERRDL